MVEGEIREAGDEAGLRRARDCLRTCSGEFVAVWWVWRIVSSAGKLHQKSGGYMDGRRWPFEHYIVLHTASRLLRLGTEGCFHELPRLNENNDLAISRKCSCLHVIIA